MKRFLVFLFVFTMAFYACDMSGGEDKEDVTQGESTEQPIDDSDTVDVSDESNDTDSVAVDPVDQIPIGVTVAPTQEEIDKYPRLSAFDSDGVWWLRKPVKSREVVYNIADGDPISAYCTKPGWAYIFYDDQAVIGYEPFPDRVGVMHDAVRLTVESHNMEYPNEEWGYINVLPHYDPPNTSNDPILSKWQYALCIDDGTIVEGPYTAEYDWEWQMWKDQVAYVQRDSYNQLHDPDAHIVWGPDK